MRGSDYFIQPDETEWIRSYDRAFITWQTRQMTGRNPRDFGTQPATRAEGDAIYMSVATDNDYNRWRTQRDQELEGERVLWRGVDPLNLDKLDEVSVDRPRLKPFRLRYDTLEEVRMRFHKTVILVKGHPFYVTDQRNIHNVFHLLLEDTSKKKFHIQIDDIPDLRQASPGYVKVGDANGYLKRLPARVNQQGMTSNSVLIRKVGNKDHLPLNQHLLMEALSSRGKTLPWDKSYRRLIDDRIVNTFRLSDSIALYKKPQQDAVLVEYKGRRLGELSDHTVKVFDEDDVIQPWLKTDAEKVHLEIAS